jgi:signal transduction histidine kinase
VQESVGVQQESFGVAPILRFSRRFTTKLNPYYSFRTRLGLTISSIALFLSQLVSNLTQKENDLKASNTQLQLELTARLAALEMLSQQAEETRLALEKERQMSELKSQFIAIASHEFRTPLTSILLSCEFLRNHHHKLSEETKQRHFGQIKSSVKHLDQVIEDVLLAGRVQAGKLQFKPAPLALVNFCFELVEQLQLSAGERYNLHFVSHCSHNAMTKNLPLMDEKLLRHIFTNLLSNAIKYSPQGGDIQFNLICDLERVIFRIQDQGIGIPKEEQAELFTSFFRCSNTGNLPGTGLGLTIVKNAVELHGGQITVESEVGLGTTFTVILPLNHTVAAKKIPEKNGVSSPE